MNCNKFERHLVFGLHTIFRFKDLLHAQNNSFIVGDWLSDGFIMKLELSADMSAITQTH